MPEKFDPNNKDVLTSAKRYESLDPQRVLSIIPIFPYQVLADIGCGPGFFTIPLGKSVFSGKVFALDVQQEMLDATSEELKRIHLSNVETKLSEESKIPLEDESLDGAFAAFVVHEADDPKALLEEIKRCMRSGAWLTLIEWHRRRMDEGPPVRERIEETKLRGMAEEVGFRLTSKHALNDKHYMLLMRK